MGKRLIGYGILFFLCIGTAYAQTDSASHKLIGLGMGLNLTKTDLSESFQKPTSSFLAYLQFAEKKKLNSAIYLSFGQSISENSQVKLLDQSEFHINSFALANFQSLHYELIYNFFNKWGLTISLAQGFGFMRFQVYDENDLLLLNKLNSRAADESYTGFSILLPTSLSFDYHFKNDFGLKARIGLQNTLTDYLDNISNFGNPNNNDNILSFQVSAYKAIKF